MSDVTSPPPSPETVRKMLAGVLDPELRASIVDLGMVHDITVSPEGDIRRNGIKVTSNTNPLMMDEFIRVLLSCHYVPGRIGGVPIPTIVPTRTAIGNPGGP